MKILMINDDSINFLRLRAASTNANQNQTKLKPAFERQSRRFSLPRTAAVAVTLSAVAVTLVFPAATPDTSPVLETVAIAGLALDQVTVLLRS